MIENQVILKVKKEHRDYIFLLAPDSPLGEVFDVLTQMRSAIIQRIEAAGKEEAKKEDQ